MSEAMLLGRFQALMASVRKNTLVDHWFLWHNLQKYLKKNVDLVLKKLTFQDISREKLEKLLSENIQAGEINRAVAIAYILNKLLNHMEIETMLKANIENDACGCLFFLGFDKQKPHEEIMNFLQTKNAEKIIKQIIFTACEHSNFHALIKLIKIVKNKDCNQEEIINLIANKLDFNQKITGKFNWIKWETITQEKKLTLYEATKFIASIIYKSFFT